MLRLIDCPVVGQREVTRALLAMSGTMNSGSRAHQAHTPQPDEASGTVEVHARPRRQPVVDLGARPSGGSGQVWNRMSGSGRGYPFEGRAVKT
jgi:hypothetical protein